MSQLNPVRLAGVVLLAVACAPPASVADSATRLLGLFEPGSIVDIALHSGLPV